MAVATVWTQEAVAAAADNNGDGLMVPVILDFTNGPAVSQTEEIVVHSTKVDIGMIEIAMNDILLFAKEVIVFVFIVKIYLLTFCRA